MHRWMDGCSSLSTQRSIDLCMQLQLATHHGYSENIIILGNLFLVLPTLLSIYMRSLVPRKASYNNNNNNNNNKESVRVFIIQVLCDDQPVRVWVRLQWLMVQQQQDVWGGCSWWRPSLQSHSCGHKMTDPRAMENL